MNRKAKLATLLRMLHFPIRFPMKNLHLLFAALTLALAAGCGGGSSSAKIGLNIELTGEMPRWEPPPRMPPKCLLTTSTRREDSKLPARSNR